MKLRKARFSGRFYPDKKDQISLLLKKTWEIEISKHPMDIQFKQIFGAILPHAGYVYSAYQAIHYFEILRRSEQQFDTVVLVNPNHTGLGSIISLDGNDAWETPYGQLAVDKELREMLPFKISSEAHASEHSGEVILPYFQFYFQHKFKILPITLLEQTPENAAYIASEIFRATKKLNRKIQFVASSDFSHFQTSEIGAMLDQYVIDEILQMNARGVYEKVQKHHISACGYGPMMSLINFAQLMNPQSKAKILKRGHSGQVTLSDDEVVDYVSILFFDE
jgi:AmmeMemoRadiSam system protein B